MACSSTFPNIEVASREHEMCRTYSCRYLSDWHVSFDHLISGSSTLNHTVRCFLCEFETSNKVLGVNSIRLQYDCQKHAESHGLRDCAQGVFTDEVKFVEHMRTCHGATRQLRTTNWYLLLHLWKSPATVYLRAMITPTESPFCTSDHSMPFFIEEDFPLGNDDDS